MGKKDDPSYEQLRGHVPKALARQFKQFCLDQELDYSKGLQQILEDFFQAQQLYVVESESQKN